MKPATQRVRKQKSQKLATDTEIKPKRLFLTKKIKDIITPLFEQDVVQNILTASISNENDPDFEILDEPEAENYEYGSQRKVSFVLLRNAYEVSRGSSEGDGDYKKRKDLYRETGTVEYARNPDWDDARWDEETRYIANLDVVCTVSLPSHCCAITDV